MTPEKHDPELEQLIESASDMIGRYLRNAHLLGIISGAEQAIRAMASPPVAADEKPAETDPK